MLHFLPKSIHAAPVFNYLISNVIDNDVKGTLQKIDTGYKHWICFQQRGYYGMKAKEFASMLNGMGKSWSPIMQ